MERNFMSEKESSLPEDWFEKGKEDKERLSEKARTSVKLLNCLD